MQERIRRFNATLETRVLRHAVIAANPYTRWFSSGIRGIVKRAVLAVLLVAAPVAARADASADRAGLLKLQAEDLRLQTIGWR